MTVLAFALLIAYVAGRMSGGRLRNLANLPLAAWLLLLPALLVQSTLSLVPKSARAFLIVLACAILLTWCLVVRVPRAAKPGLFLIAGGILANTLEVGLNGGMPVSRSALVTAGLPRNLDVTRGHLNKHVAMSSTTRLSFLGDRFPIPVIHNVLSAGDVVMLVGVVIVVRAAMLVTVAGGSALRRDRPLAASTAEHPA